MSFPTTPSNGDQTTVGGITYQYNSATNSWKRVAIGVVSGITSINDLTDVDTATNTPTNNQTLVYNSAGSVWQPGNLYTNLDVKSYLSGGTYDANIVPAVDNTYDLGSPSKMWRDVYIGPGSLYVNGKQVLSDNSDTITVSTDINQDLRLETSGTGDIEIDAAGTGAIKIQSTLQIAGGTNITSSDGNAIGFSNAIAVDNVSSKTTNTNLTLSANGTGVVTVSDDLVITGNLTVSGTTTTVNTETISLADNIIDLNSNFTTGVPTENSGIRIIRGDNSNVSLRWNETDDRWEFTNDGLTYYAIPTSNFSGSYNDLTDKPTIPTAVSELTNDAGYITAVPTPLTFATNAVAALDIDCSSGNFFTKTIAGNSTFTFSNVPNNVAYSFVLEITHTSGDITWPASVKWPSDTAPTLTTGTTHLFVFITRNGGTRWRAAVLQDYID